MRVKITFDTKQSGYTSHMAREMLREYGRVDTFTTTVGGYESFTATITEERVNFLTTYDEWYLEYGLGCEVI